MNPAVPGATSPRRAALLVHALPLRDQEWLLGSLPPHHRVELELLLEELRDLGIPPDESLLRDVVEAAAPGAGAAQRLEQLTPQQVAALVDLLRKEPPQLVATLLAARPWTWKREVLAALGEHGEQARPRRAAGLQLAVCEAVMRQLDACAPAAPVAAGRWTRLLPIRVRRDAA